MKYEGTSIKDRLWAGFCDYASATGWSLVAFRVALGLTCSGDVLFTWLQVQDFLTPPQLFQPGMAGVWSPLDAVPPGGATTAAFFGIAALGVLFALGVEGVRFVLPFALAAVRHRVPLVEGGGMAVLQLALVCTWAMPINRVGSFLQCGKVLREPHLWGALTASLRQRYFSVGFPLVCLQLAVNYGFNAYNKLTQPWTEGIAVARALSNPNLVHGAGVWLANLPESVLVVLNHGALFVEFLLPLCLLSPFFRGRALRGAALLMVGLHFFIAMTLMVGIFSYAMLCHVPLLALAQPRRSAGGSPQRGKGQLRVAAEAAFAGLFLTIMLWSLDSLWFRTGWVPLPVAVTQSAEWLRLRQGWGMFAHPLDRAFITVTRAESANGDTYDPWRSRVAPEPHPLGKLPRVAYRRHGAFDVDAHTISSDAFREKFADWLWERSLAEHPNNPPLFLIGFTLEVPAERQWLLPPSAIEDYVESFDVPLSEALDVRLEASQIWAAERMLDRRMVPEGTPVLSPVGASFSPGCAYVTLHLDPPQHVRSLLLQADAYDQFIVEGSEDGQTYEQLGAVPQVQARNYRTRLIPLAARGPLRQVRLYHNKPRARVGFVSELALYAHAPALPPLPQAPASAHYVAHYDRPAAMGLFARPARSSGACVWEQKP